jgi:hypothetical protein
MRGVDSLLGLVFSPANGRLSPEWRWDRNPFFASRRAFFAGWLPEDEPLGFPDL